MIAPNFVINYRTIFLLPGLICKLLAKI